MNPNEMAREAPQDWIDFSFHPISSIDNLKSGVQATPTVPEIVPKPPAHTEHNGVTREKKDL